MLVYLKKLSFIFLFVTILSPLGQLQSQLSPYPDNVTNSYVTEAEGGVIASYCPHDNPFVDHPTIGVIGLGYHTPRGIGYKSGYTTISSSYFPSINDADLQPFLDGRFHIFDEGRIAFNVGVGLKYLLPEANQSLGFNVYYDFRNTSYQDYHQISFGSEWLTDCLAFGFNAYIPIERNHSPYKTKILNFLGGFRAKCRQYNYSFDKVELFAGHQIDWLFSFLRCYRPYLTGGIYYLGALNSHGHRSTVGTEWRLTTEFFRSWVVEGIASFDQIFKGRIQLYIGWSLPIGGRCSTPCHPWSESGVLLRKIYAAPYRSEIIPVKGGSMICADF